MIRIAVIFLMLFTVSAGSVHGACSCGLSVDNAVSALVSRISGSLVSFDYSFETEGQETDISGEGHAVIQGKSFLIEGNGFFVWCNGTDVWSVDTVAKEVVIESLSSDSDILANPASIITELDSMFGWSNSGVPVSFNSIPSVKYDLVPNDNVGADSVSLYFKRSDNSLVGAVIDLQDGSSLVFSISDFRCADSEDISSYSMEKFDSSYVVTDLR